MKGPRGQIAANKGEESARAAGDHPKDCRENEHLAKTIRQQERSGRGNDEHRRNQDNADGLERRHNRKGEKQHQAVMKNLHGHPQ